MTLEEAIKHCEEQAEILRRTAAQIARAKSGFFKYEQYRECARDHDQLAEWLKELKAYREAEEEINKLVYKNIDLNKPTCRKRTIKTPPPKLTRPGII